MIKAFAYLRTSSAVNLDGDSPDRQREAIRHFAAAAGYAVVSEFYDQAVSGTDDVFERPAFSALLDALEDDGTRTVIVEDASRFARSTLASELGILALRQRGVTLLAANGDNLTDDTDEMREAMRTIATAFAQAERKRLVRRLKSGRDRASMANGSRVEGRKGYIETDHVLIREAKRLRRKSPKTGRRRSLRQIAEVLAEQGYRTRFGQPFSAAQVSRLIGPFQKMRGIPRKRNDREPKPEI